MTTSGIFDRDRHGQYPLQRACEDGDISRVEELLAEKNPLEARDFQGKTALQTACQRGHLEIVQILLKHGARVNSKDDFGGSPLHKTTSIEIAKCLLSHGARVNDVNDFDQTPRLCQSQREMQNLLGEAEMIKRRVCCMCRLYFPRSELMKPMGRLGALCENCRKGSVDFGVYHEKMCRRCGTYYQGQSMTKIVGLRGHYCLKCVQAMESSEEIGKRLVRLKYIPE